MSMSTQSLTNLVRASPTDLGSTSGTGPYGRTGSQTSEARNARTTLSRHTDIDRHIAYCDTTALPYALQGGVPIEEAHHLDTLHATRPSLLQYLIIG